MRPAPIFLAAAIVITSGSLASAHTCQDVLRFVQQHGWIQSVKWARANLTPAQQRAALACLTKRRTKGSVS